MYYLLLRPDSYATIHTREVSQIKMQDIRPSPIAGTWYPGDSEVLSQAIDRQLKDCAVSPIPGTIVGIIAPHAGHRYSGHVAASAFRSLEGMQPKVVAVISPLHQPYAGEVLTTGHAAYGTPLGSLPVDHDLVDQFEAELARNSRLELTRVRRDGEHSLEIELPFLQRALHQPFRLLPLMLRDQTQFTSEAVGHALATVLAEEASLLVASSDLSHFYPQATAQRLDSKILALIEAFDPAGILAAEEKATGFACGRAAIAAVLWAAKDLGADCVKILSYATSGDVTGDYSSVVGYGAAAIYRQSRD
jgi:AmmeMemoRadiSam system protein B